MKNQTSKSIAKEKTKRPFSTLTRTAPSTPSTPQVTKNPEQGKVVLEPRKVDKILTK
jgi:hypothetical protein